MGRDLVFSPAWDGLAFADLSLLGRLESVEQSERGRLRGRGNEEYLGSTLCSVRCTLCSMGSSFRKQQQQQQQAWTQTMLKPAASSCCLTTSPFVGLTQALSQLSEMSYLVVLGKSCPANAVIYPKSKSKALLLN